MAERNIILPIKRVSDVQKRIPGTADRRRKPQIPPGVQARRLGPGLRQAFSNILDRDDYNVESDPAALAPERVLVFEIIGSPADFVNAAKRVGLEWLAEEIATLTGVRDYLDIDGDGHLDEDDDEDRNGDRLINELVSPPIDDTPGRFYVGMPTVETFNKLRSLWNQYESGAKAPDKHSDWWRLFSSLHAIRTWAPQDRVSDLARQRLANQILDDAETVRLEIDLWYREQEADQKEALTGLSTKVEAAGGRVLDHLRLERIRYHAALIELPASAVAEIVEATGAIVVANEVMSIRPQTAFRFGIDEPGSIEQEFADKPETPNGASIAALLDGYPVENHELLRDRIDVVPVDIEDSMAPVSRRYHGTSMASLILHGDLHVATPAIGRPLKIVPVLAPDEDGFESPPGDKLALRTILRAVKELKKGTDGGEPSGADVILINHSICDEALAFSGTISPWARLLDALSYHYKVLFVVSAGNIDETFAVPAFSTIQDFRTATVEDRRKAVLISLENAKARRGILAPAEGVNCLTVGAAHHDASPMLLPSNNVDPYGPFAMSNLNSGLGLGFARAVKPDLILPGGRQIAHPTLSMGALSVRGAQSNTHYGQKTASPDPAGHKLNMTRHSAGTSNAAALATRSGLLIADALDETFAGAEDVWHRRPTAACMLKALIAHGAEWGPVGEHLDGLYPPDEKHARRRENIARYIGYGFANEERVIAGSQHRVTLLADDLIRMKQRHEYRIPLPDELSSRLEFRRITATLAWLTPVRSHSANYRAVGLELVGGEGRSGIWSGVRRVATQPPLTASKKGTLIHAVYEGDGIAVPFAHGSDFILNVQATSALSRVAQFEIPYALAVTIEVATTINADIRTTIRDRVQPRVGVR